MRPKRDEDVAKTVQLVPAALKRVREGTGLRQYQVAARSGLSKAQVSCFETGRVSPSVASLISYLSGIGRDLSDLQREIDRIGASHETPPLPPVEAMKQKDRERAFGRAVIRAFTGLLKDLRLDRVEPVNPPQDNGAIGTE